jgi:hypothetical protein
VGTPAFVDSRGSAVTSVLVLLYGALACLARLALCKKNFQEKKLLILDDFQIAPGSNI